MHNASAAKRLAGRARATLGAELNIEGLADANVEDVAMMLRTPNPKYAAAFRAHRDVRRIDPYVRLAAIEPDGSLVIPRGAFASVRALLEDHGVALELVDETLRLQDLDVELRSPLRPEQAALVAALTKHAQGIVVCPTGGGKTFVAAGIVEAVKQPTLIIVPTVDIIDQFVATFRTCFGVEIGVLAEGRADIADISVGTPQGVLKQLEIVASRFGCVVVDECHRAASPTYREIFSRMPARHRYGMTGTPDRADGSWRVVESVIGPVRASISRAELEQMGRLVQATYAPEATTFTFGYRGQQDWHALLDAVATSDDRNVQIADRIASECANGVVGLALTGRVEHAKQLEQVLSARGLRAKALFGSMPKRERVAVLEEARSGQLDVLVGTQLADEGLDIPRLSRLFLTFPSRAEPRLVQRVGRILRPHPEKQDALVVDFVDVRVGVLSWQAKQRAKSFRNVCGGRS